MPHVRSISLVLVLVAFSLNARAQDNDIDFLIHHIKDTYAGYQDKVKGHEREFDTYIKDVIRKEKADTFRILGSIVAYFDNPHLQLTGIINLKSEKIDSIQATVMEEKVKRYFVDLKKQKDRYEGYWMNENKTTTIALLKTGKDTYNGYFIESGSARVPSGYYIGKIEKKPNGKYYSDFISTRYGARYLARSVFRNDSTLIVDITKWHKVGYRKPSMPDTVILPSHIYTSGKLLDSDNYLLTLPDFTSRNIPIVDSIVKADFEKITKAKNLILDIRDNTGGTVRTYAPLVQFVATKPIKAVEGYKYCTEGLLQHRRDQIKAVLATNPVDSNTFAELIKDSAIIQANLGKFVFEPGDTTKFEGEMSTPQNVAIIINYSVQSAAEMMILDFKQSKKVKIFGENTMGAVDYLNTFSLRFPSGKYILGLATFKRYLAPGEYPIDQSGIPPDIKISGQNQDWVGVVRSYYEQQKQD